MRSLDRFGIGGFLSWVRGKLVGEAKAQPAAETRETPAPKRNRGAAAKQAVVLIHGMGEQIPMDTVRGFVDTVWEKAGIAASGLASAERVWSRPDIRTGSLELRRITTRESIASDHFPGGVRTDFYELYWADLTAGSTWAQFVSWVRYLLFRPWSEVPRDVRLAWVLLWIASIIVAAMALLSLIPDAVWKSYAPDWLPQKLVLALAAAFGAVLHRVATASFGRVVRYTRAEPDNIAARAAVRARGLNLLRALHRDATYDRVIIVGHSLGTILAYDLVSYFWAEQTAARTVAEDEDAFHALCALEQAAADLDDAPDEQRRTAYRIAQRKLFGSLSARLDDQSPAERRWLISDLVTIGSPLTHAEFLLAKGEADLNRRKEERELPTAPPYRESLDPNVLRLARVGGRLPIAEPGSETRLMVFPAPGQKGAWVLHHAAPFAAVRWTNLHDPARFVFIGDIISGPLRDAFGEGVEDVDLALIDRPAKRFSHTRYWAPDISLSRRDALRQAINLLDLPELTPIKIEDAGAQP